MIAETFGIPPWEQREKLTVRELLGACDYIDAMNKRAEG